MPINISKMGHAVLRVTDLERSLRFYRDVLGLRATAAVTSTAISGCSSRPATATTISPWSRRHPGLHHLAFQLDGSLPELADTNASLHAAGVDVHATLDFRVSQALFISDPDDNLIELYVDTPGEPWRAEPTLVANADPLDLPRAS